MAMASVELIYDADCPHVAAARRQIRAACARVGLEPRWSEHLRDEAPPTARGYGSPTILIDGRDVANEQPIGERACRVYPSSEGGLAGVPSVDAIASALSAANGSPSAPTRGWKRNIALVPGIAASLLPKVACPACWPAYAGFLSSIGLGFLLDTAWLFPLTAVFLATAVGALAFRAASRRGFGPALLGVVAAVLVLVGKFSLDSAAMMYFGLAVLISASLWNSWPKKKRDGCAACAPEGA
jgi:mercuric ion transport protein